MIQEFTETESQEALNNSIAQNSNRLIRFDLVFNKELQEFLHFDYYSDDQKLVLMIMLDELIRQAKLNAYNEYAEEFRQNLRLVSMPESKAH